MKVIKFKGKRIDNNEWVYGDFARINGDSFILRNSHQGRRRFIDEVPEKIKLSKGKASMVYDDSIAQFTGVYDRDGKEIYEGDRVMIEYSNETMFGQVFWRDFFCAWCIRIDSGATERIIQISERLTESYCKVIN